MQLGPTGLFLVVRQTIRASPAIAVTGAATCRGHLTGKKSNLGEYSKILILGIFRRGLEETDGNLNGAGLRLAIAGN